MTQSTLEERKKDGRQYYSMDDNIESLLNEHFEKFNISKQEICRNFQIYTRRIYLKRFLAHYEFFQKVINLPGDIVELGVYRGASLMSWANFLEIRCMGHRQKQIFGFDNFQGFNSFDEKDGKEDSLNNKTINGYNSEVFEDILKDAISIYDKDRFIPYKSRVVLIKGDITETLPKFIIDNPGLRVSLLHFDCDMYKPTKIALELLYPLVVQSGVILFDEYGIRPWQGESNAVDEYFANKNIIIKCLDWSSAPGGYIIKGSK